MKNTAFVLVAGLCLALGACSDEPSESAMHQAMTEAMTRLYQQHMAAAAFMLGGPRGGGVPPMPRITTLRKVGCIPAETRPGYLCEYEASVDGKPPVKERVRFYKAPLGTYETALGL